MTMYATELDVESRAAANLGAIGDVRISAGVHELFYESMGRPHWQLAGTTLENLQGSMPRNVSVADDVRMMENIVDQIGAAGFIDHVVKNRMRLCGRASLLAIYYAPTLEAGLDFIAGYIGRSHPYINVERSTEPGFIVYRIRPSLRLGRAWPGIGAIFPLALQQLVASIAFQDTARLKVDIDDAMAMDTHLHASWFSCPVRCVNQTSGIAIPIDLATRPNELADVGLWDLACHRLDAEANALDRSPEASRIRALVQKMLASQHRVPSIKEAASSLRLSERTLIRRLAQANTSFRALVDDERKARALSLIIDPSFDIQEVSDRLGFPDRSIFGRKFRRWTGETPSNYRLLRTPGKWLPALAAHATTGVAVG